MICPFQSEPHSPNYIIYETYAVEKRKDRKYDLIFVDAAKAQYGKYLEMFIDNLRPEGKMVFDNMIFHGLIYDVDSIMFKNIKHQLF